MDDALPSKSATRPTTLQWQWSRLADLPAVDLYEAMATRQDVFSVEQACAFQDADGMDVWAWHLLGWHETADDRRLAAYLRVIDPGRKFAEPSIGRVLTARAYRGAGLGRLLMQEGLARTAAAHPGHSIRIAAQQHLAPFYSSLGFVIASPPYLEDGILHVDMLRPDT